jgi:hypothetical protein
VAKAVTENAVAANVVAANAWIQNCRRIVPIALRDVTHEIDSVQWHTILRCILMTAGDELK